VLFSPRCNVFHTLAVPELWHRLQMEVISFWCSSICQCIVRYFYVSNRLN
jgi:hypothetical protein